MLIPYLSSGTARRRSCYTNRHCSTLSPAQEMVGCCSAGTLLHYPKCSPSEGPMSHSVLRERWSTAGRNTGPHCCKTIHHTNILSFSPCPHLQKKKTHQNSSLNRWSAAVKDQLHEILYAPLMYVCMFVSMYTYICVYSMSIYCIYGWIDGWMDGFSK